ncbi:MAG: DEAD/DEAH box helicase family protein [Bacteroidales bacterium]|nr:DEAD/DEAH box helicase family protein [Bacteroidales bacterium]
MRFKFKIQKYQTDAVDSVVNVFEGQPFVDNLAYRLDSGKNIDYETEAYKNADIILDDVALLKNIKTIQSNNSIKQSSALFNALGKCQLDVEMETGTGKTYVYIKTMFELNKKYGWSKYIIVVPSVAIREGVYKSFQMLETHFYEQYGKKIRFNIYTSKNLGLIDTFSTDGGINVLIINSQAFATSMKENGRSKESKIMYSKRDEFASRRPIDVLSANKPIVILDEPQRLEGAATQTGIAKFNPLFTINFSATHRVTHNLVYALDALDAYNQKLVKKIQVKTVEVENLRGTSAYMYLDDIVLSRNNPPRAKIEIQTKLTSGTITTATKLFDVKDNLEVESGLKVYEGYVVSNIDAIKGQVEFLNGCILRKGEVQGM